MQSVLQGSDEGPDGRSEAAYAEVADSLEQAVQQRKSIDSLERAWLFRLIHSPHALSIRVALMWHGHFPINTAKVSDVDWVLQYSKTLRELWDRPVSHVYLAMLRDPAMLRWLDGLSNSRSQPNENLAREFLELFALGEGAYSEVDIRECARALTGMADIRHDDGSTTVELDPNKHDGGDKTIFGKTGPWNVEDVVRITCKQREAATHIARRLFQTFVTDQEYPSDSLLAPVADHMRKNGDVDILAGVEMILRSELFYDPKYRGQRVKSPIELIVGAVRGCAAFRPAPNLNRLLGHAQRMGQRLFHTPSVAGWPSGLAWLEGPWAIARANFAVDFPHAVKGIESVNTTDKHELSEQLRATLWAMHASPVNAEERMATALGNRASHLEITKWLLSQPEAQLA